MKKTTSKHLEASEEARSITEIIVSIASSVLDYLKAVHVDLRQSLQRLHSMFPVVLPALAAIGAALQLITNPTWFADKRKYASLNDESLEKEAQNNGLDVERLKKQREAALQDIFRFGGNVFLCMVYTALAILLAMFPGSIPILIAALAISQAIATWRFAYALFEQRFSQRKWLELYPDSSSQDRAFDEDAFQKLLQHAVYHKAIMALCNAIAVGMSIVATLFPPSAAMMTAMSFVMVLLVIGISISYQHHKVRLQKDVCPDTAATVYSPDANVVSSKKLTNDLKNNTLLLSAKGDTRKTPFFLALFSKKTESDKTKKNDT